MRKLLICIALFMIMAGALSGCWSRKEMSELAIVLGAGVDRAPGDQVRLTLQIARPGALAGGGGEGGRGTEPSTWVISETGSTIQDAQRKLSSRISRHIYWAHSIVLIFGEGAAREGIRKYSNFFSRGVQPRETMWFMVAKGEAKDVLETESELERSSAQDIGFLARARTGLTVNWKDFIVMLAHKGGNPVATRVEVVDRGITSGGAAQESSARRRGAELTGTAVFREDKLAGWLDQSETRGLLWLRGEVLEGIITFPSPTEEGKEISLQIVRGQTEVEPHYDGESIRFDVNIDLEGDLVEQQSLHENILDPHLRDTMEKVMAGEVGEKTGLALEKAQREYGLDIFEFGLAFHRKYPRQWLELRDRWDQLFSAAEVNIAVEAHIRRSGLQGRRTTVPEK